MRRHVLHIAAALLTFTVGFLTVGEAKNLTVALPLALLVFSSVLLFERIRFPRFDSHKLKVAVLTVLLWIPVLLVFLPLIIPQSGLSNCTLDISEEEYMARPAYPELVPEDTVITLRRTGCFGACPAYTLSIFSDGSVVFYGEPRYGFTRVKGAARGWISQEQLRQLVSEFERVDYFSLRDRYETVGDGCPTVWTDSSWAITSIQINSRKKMIEHYHGCAPDRHDWSAFPRELTELETRIDEVAGSEQWVR